MMMKKKKKKIGNEIRSGMIHIFTHYSNDESGDTATQLLSKGREEFLREAHQRKLLDPTSKCRKDGGCIA